MSDTPTKQRSPWRVTSVVGLVAVLVLLLVSIWTGDHRWAYTALVLGVPFGLAFIGAIAAIFGEEL